MHARATQSLRARRLAAVAALSLAAVAVIAIGTRGGDGRTLRAVFHSAVNVVPGQEVRVAGRKVGEVGSVEELDGDAVLELEVGDDAWPLRRGTTARLRYGSLSGYAARFVELRPGPRSAPALPDGGVLTTANTITPVEFDEIFNTYDRPSRRNLQGLLANAADTLDGHGDDVARGLSQGSGGWRRLADMTADVADDRAALRKLVRAGARTAAALRRRDPALRRLFGHAAGTFDELAAHARAQQAALDRFPAAMRGGGRTLRRLDQSLGGMQGLVDDLRPGARGLRRVAPSVRGTAAAVIDVAPVATATLTSGARAAPHIDRLLRAGAPFMPRLGSVLGQLAPMVACLRPYGPEIAGWASTWIAGSNVDEVGAYGRSNTTQLPPGLAPGSKMTSKQIVETYRDRIFYAFPRPPGLNAGQPWFMPQCGVGRDALDPSKDPETTGSGR